MSRASHWVYSGNDTVNWFASHEWLAAWLALPVAIVIGVVQNAPTKFEHLDWSRSLLGLAFLTALAVAFTPTFDESARTAARCILGAGVGWLMIEAARKR